MKLKFAGILFAVVVCASVANAERTTSTQAMAVARAIVARGTTMGERIGSTVESVAESPDTTAPFFAVKMRGGGTIITSGDTEIDPIIAILPGGEDFKNIPEGHPLLALLKRDIALRQQVVDERANLPVVFMMSASVNASAKTSRGKWEKLLAEDETRNRPRFMSMMSFVDGADDEEKKYDPERESAAITDMRVEPLVEAQWNQSGGGENEFTPEHSVCGCVATATAQIMHKFQWPTNDVIPFKNTCSFNDVESEYTARGGAYDWANMPPKNAGVFGVEAEAIGQLTYNCGVAVGMMWSPRSSGAYAEYLPAAYERLGYAQALMIADHTGGNLALHSVENLEKYVFPSLDVGSPVQISISDEHGGSGHSIVGDGYGFIEDAGEKIPYIHINMGWGESGYNAWYNFPTVPYTATIDGGRNEYAIIKGFIYNILPEFPTPKLPGQSAYVLSGRAMDEEGAPIEKAEVKILNAEEVVVSVVTTQEHGVWGAVLGCEGPYSILAYSEANNISGEIAGVPFLLTQNSWGNDIELTNFSVENMTTHEMYSSLNRAIVNAADGDKLEVFTQSVVRVSCQIDKELTICGRDGVAPEILGVSISPSVQLNVASSGALNIKNLTFRRGARNFDTRTLCTEVASNGFLRIENVNGLEQITLHDSTNFVFAGSVTNPIYIVSKNFPCAAGSPFGSYVGTDAADYANYLLNDADDELGGIPKEDGTLVWGNASIPDAAASVRLDQDGVLPTNYRTFAALLRHCTGDVAIEVLKSSTALDEELPVSNKVKIFSRGTAPSIKATERAHFAVKEGGELLLTNVIVVAGNKKKGSALFDINGGNMTMESGAVIDGFNHTGVDIWNGAGAIQLTSGRLTLRPGAAVRNCSTDGNGGAIFAKGGVVAIEGGQIKDCLAKGMYGGGGIFAYVPETQILVSGSPFISDNIWCTNNKNKTDNLHLEEYSSLASAPIEVVGDMGVDARVGVMIDASKYGMNIGDTFALAASAPMTTEAKALVAHAFLNDAAPVDRMAAWSEASGHEQELVWTENTLKGEVLPGSGLQAIVRTTDADGQSHLYCTLRDAFEYMKGPSDVELLVDDVKLVGGLTIPYDVTIRTMSETNEVFAISHTGDDSGVLVVPTGISLTLTNVNFLCTGEAHHRAIDVKGGSLTLEVGTRVSGYTGGVLDLESGIVDGTRASSAIVVWNGGTFTMMGGAVIANCHNTFLDDPANVNEGAGGAVLIDGATGHFLGGVITNCSAAAGGAVALCNEAVAYVSGDLTIAANTDRIATEFNAAPSDLVVEDLCKVYLAAPFGESARVGRLAGFKADTNIVAYVENWQNWDFASLTNSAAKFFNDEAVKVHGFVVTNESNTALVVWSTSIAEDGSFVWTNEKGEWGVYHAVAAVPEIEDDPLPPVVTVITNTPTPIAFKSITRISGTEWQLVVTDLVEKCEYALTYMENPEAGFSNTGMWMKAESSGPWTTNIVFEAEKPVYFWKALGRETYEEKVEE